MLVCDSLQKKYAGKCGVQCTKEYYVEGCVTPILHETGCMGASIEYKSERTPRGVQTNMLYICANNSKCRTLLTGSVGNDYPSFISVLIPIHIVELEQTFAANHSLSPCAHFIVLHNHGISRHMLPHGVLG